MMANSATASVATRKAELQRLQVLRGYQQIVSPFDGVITRRGTDPGAPVPVIPASALIVRKEGTLVARVQNSRLTLVPVTLGRDFGKELEILEVAVGDDVVMNASDVLETGQQVEVLPPPRS